MRILLDTQVVLWQLKGSRPVGPKAATAISDAQEVFFSVVSFAEIGVKASIGKLTVPEGFRDIVVDHGLQILRLDAEHGLRVAALPLHHRDPFDRLLIAQANENDLTMVTSDKRIAEYEVGCIDASR